MTALAALRIVAVVGAAALTSCQSDPYFGDYTRTKPAEGDLVGAWTPNQDAVARMRDKGGYDTSRSATRFEFKADGTFSMVDMPDWWQDGLGRSHRTFRSDSGRWEIHQELDSNTWGIALSNGEFVALRRQKPPYLIHLVIGDPDLGDAMVFTKSSQ